ncbi:MAG: glycosyl hydrolase 115 family protein [Prevotella sp.]|nr:glycosyl hydrolase 115 family protein [Prevotella sp.]
MKLKTILTGAFLLLTLQSPAAPWTWYGGRGAVGYTIQKKYATSVAVALQLFEGDMAALTGHKAKKSSDGVVRIYQLDKLSNKEFKQLAAEQMDYQKIITAPDAYLIAVRNAHIIIVGSNGRGTAYGILQLSRLAAQGQSTSGHTTRLIIDTNYRTVQIPQVRLRAISLDGNANQSNAAYSQLCHTLLRLGINAYISSNRQEQAFLHQKMHRKILDSCEIVINPSYKATRSAVINLSALGKNTNRLWVSSMQPGAIYAMGTYAYDKGDTDLWRATLSKIEPTRYDLRLYADMAWNQQNIDRQGLKAHLTNWLAEYFGQDNARRLEPLFTEYYHLTGICHPELIHDSGREFNEGEFGNELDRYLSDFENLKRRCDNIERIIPTRQRDAFLHLVKYPIYAAATTARMELQAQEARNIARPGNFYQDTEALQAAANSMKAYRELVALNRQMNNGTTEVKAPVLPGTLTDKQINSYTYDEDYEVADLDSKLGQVTAMNARDYTSKTGDIRLIALLGHSNGAIYIPKGGSVTYSFYAKADRPGLFRIAFTPTVQTQTVEVSYDGNNAMQYTITANDDDWQAGQMILEVPVTPTEGQHTLTITARSSEVIADQWMLDFDNAREFYVFPVK